MSRRPSWLTEAATHTAVETRPAWLARAGAHPMPPTGTQRLHAALERLEQCGAGSTVPTQIPACVEAWACFQRAAWRARGVK